MDRVTVEKRSEIMSRIRGSGTKPERAVELALSDIGIRYRRQCADMPGRPDVFLPDHNVAVFVNGCFWHGCGKHHRTPKTNRKFWKRKIGRNVARQTEVLSELAAAGTEVMVIWKHEIGTGEHAERLWRLAGRTNGAILSCRSSLAAAGRRSAMFRRGSGNCLRLISTRTPSEITG